MDVWQLSAYSHDQPSFHSVALMIAAPEGEELERLTASRARGRQLLQREGGRCSNYDAERILTEVITCGLVVLLVRNWSN